MLDKNTLNSTQILIMAITAGICVANVYYSQPILGAIAVSLGTDEKSAGLISVLSQAGYGLGLFFITPLGDKIERKKLILCLQIFLVLSLVAISLSPNMEFLYFWSLAVGLCAVSAQVILPMAASLVSENRGKVVGIIFTGILVGVLAARVFSGFITEWLGWRYVFILSAALVVISGILMQADFPKAKERFQGSYLDLLRSTFEQFKKFADLRRTALVGALTFGTLSAFWIALTFHLAGKPFNYSTDKIGLFGILAVVGALLVPLVGKTSDVGVTPKRSLTITLSLVILSVVLLKIFPFSVIALAAAVVLLDIGVQASQVTNIALIYTLDSKANSRINTVYMTCYFIGGATGAYIGLLCWKAGGWSLVTWQMLAFTVLALALVLSGKTQLKHSS